MEPSESSLTSRKVSHHLALQFQYDRLTAFAMVLTVLDFAILISWILKHSLFCSVPFTFSEVKLSLLGFTHAIVEQECETPI